MKTLDTSDAAYESAKTDLDKARKAWKRSRTDETVVVLRMALDRFYVIANARVAQQEASYAEWRQTHVLA